MSNYWTGSSHPAINWVISHPLVGVCFGHNLTDLPFPFFCFLLFLRNSKVFFTDYGSTPRVERCDMDGQNRTKLVDSKIVFPHGITLDLVNRMVYWADAYLDYIEVVDYEGKNRHTIIQGLLVRTEGWLKKLKHKKNTLKKIHMLPTKLLSRLNFPKRQSSRVYGSVSNSLAFRHFLEYHIGKRWRKRQSFFKNI